MFLSGIEQPLVLIRGAGDLASGIAYRLCQARFPVVMLEVDKPLVVRRTASFATAVFTGKTTVEGLTAYRVNTPEEVDKILKQNQIPLLIDPSALCIEFLKPQVLVDAIMAKKNLGTLRNHAAMVIGLGPGFEAGADVDAVVETMRGHYLGRVIWQGSAMPDTGVPGEVGGYTEERLIRAPENGIWVPLVTIGDRVQKGEVLATVGETIVPSRISGIVRGLLYPGLEVCKGMKVGDIDPRGEREHCFTISDKALAVAGGVLEAIIRGLNSGRVV
ncbi:MAG: selenium-dependent molybdenum cofactor biosynthesis protein YqeB [Thermincola sp.]|jgi:xanthine dehydrogenase accessory factor|nr:selenium-dependent molybdenum cofactor biosynthesis protein YqeB [Thermincola sp.]MDT3702594.1 selenium-dependent molybdenum cofactor biosynthesis protein YqeB [Thermincola sp.]